MDFSISGFIPSMSGHTPEAVQKQVKIYIGVFIALAALTVVTVSVGYLHLPLREAVIVALFIATIKASLVAAFFMHLSSEKKIIYSVLILAVFFFAFLLVYPSLHHI